MLEFLSEYRLEGLFVGLCTFLIIGIYHPLVIKGEYYFGEKIKWWFLVAGIIFLAGSLAVEGVVASALLGVASFSSFWSIVYDGGAHINGIAKGDSIGVVYQKNNPENNMTVFEYFDGPEYGAVTIFVIIAIVLAVYRWLRINRKYNDRCPELDSLGKCAIYRTDKEYIFVTVYYVNASYPIKFLPLDCDNGAFENTLTDIFQASKHDKYTEIKASELIKAMKQRSWRQLYMHCTSVLVTYDSSKLGILPTRKATGRGLDWDYDRELTFELDSASWKDIINSMRKLLEPNETDR